MLHHSRYVGLVFGASPFKEVDDDSKASSADLRVITHLSFVQVQKTNYQNKSLHGIGNTLMK